MHWITLVDEQQQTKNCTNKDKLGQLTEQGALGKFVQLLKKIALGDH